MSGATRSPAADVPVPAGPDDEDFEVLPLVVVAQTFPARPSSIPRINDFLTRCIAQSPLSEQDGRAVTRRVSAALLEAAGPSGTIHVSFRMLPDRAEVDVLRSAPGTGPGFTGTDDHGAAGVRTGDGAAPGPADGTGDDGASFASWLDAALRREGLTIDAAARHLGVSVKTVSRWVGGSTEPRLRDLRRIRRLLGDLPFG